MSMWLLIERFMRRGRNKWIYLLLVLTLMGTAGFMYLRFYLPDSVYSKDTRVISSLVYSKPLHGFSDALDQLRFRTDLDGQPLLHTAQTDVGPSFEDVVEQNLKFDIEGRDVIVFLHIQKTGGTTFGQHLVTDLEVGRPCACYGTVKWCTCPRPGKNSSETWLFSRHTTGWRCGVHAGWTELVNCVDKVMNRRNGNRTKKRYFYITMLRHPVHRFISEFLHVRRQAGWNNAHLKCQGRRATKMEVPPCYHTKIWENVTMDEFIACSSNLAMNRETRMLADLSLVGCYNTSLMSHEDKGRIMLQSAKSNLKKMAFYGLTEEQEISQYLFEVVFNLRFRKQFKKFNQTFTDMSMMNLDADTIKRIEELNSLDLELYKYAVELFQQRLDKLSAQDNKRFS